MRKFRILLPFPFILLWLSACNPTYLPVTPTGIAQVDEFEAGVYMSFGSLGRTIRPLGFRGVVANFGLYVRKGVMEGMDWTVAVDNCSINAAIGVRQQRDESAVMRPRLGIGWMSAVFGLDYAVRLSHAEDTSYSVGGAAMAWVGDAFWTDDPGKAYGLRVGPFGHVGAEIRGQSIVAGGARLDYAPLQFGGAGAPETLVDFFGGRRNPYATPVDRGVLADWPKPRVAFIPGAFIITGGPAIAYHKVGANWVQGGRKDED